MCVCVYNLFCTLLEVPWGVQGIDRLVSKQAEIDKVVPFFLNTYSLSVSKAETRSGVWGRRGLRKLMPPVRLAPAKSQT